MPGGNKRAGGVNVSTTIPSKSSGRLMDALTDIIRPFSEARGLKADRIRLQREDVLIEIAKKARARLVIEKEPIKPIPNKILVPLLEAASNEDIKDDYMVEMWTKLLVSAAKDMGVQPRYVGIMRELGGRQAQILHRLATR